MTVLVEAESARASRATQRISSLDIVRGVVMVLMAIDHVRVYSGVPAGGATAGLFLTRWVTHFCAPAFVFFAGTAAFLHGRALADRSALARFLATRGLLLVALELTMIHFMWTFSLSSMTAQLAGVIWMLGWCMILLAAMIRLPTWAVAAFGVLVMAAQDVIRLLPSAIVETGAWFWQFLYLGGEVSIGGGAVTFSVLYTIVPWIGVMAAGYAFGQIMIRDARERHRLCLAIGLSATALFVAIGGAALWLAPAGDDAPPALFRLLNQRKYPASQLFLLMTLGPAIAALAWCDGARSRAAAVFETFGRVPLFYYLLHIPLIHVVALGVWLARDGRMGAERFVSAPYVSIPEAERWSLPLLYLVFAGVVVVLYFMCRWYAAFKTTRRHPWLRYV